MPFFLTIFEKISILEVLQGFKYASVDNCNFLIFPYLFHKASEKERFMKIVSSF